MTGAEALAALEAEANPDFAAREAAYHKALRRYLGIPVPRLTELADGWREGITLDDRLALASALWDSDIHDARIAAAKLLTQARIRPDDEPVWRLIASWVPTFDAWAIADAASSAGGRRLTADPRRLDEVETWVDSDHLWTRRAALVMTLPWTKDRFPKPEDLAVRERVLGWCEALSPDRDWFIQKAVAWWLRDLSKKDPDRVRAWLDAHGEGLKPFARKEAARLLPT
ncbi:DNA alkylation repair enzyme [Rubellimicrobium mesophilum DSM 19309]|uniref:DNA alkylation repair enzyme n=1 Tax=Rubellimicrobium mesophilum DSM 19309 TaxID=442562 RepID=A0A017HMZ3_9RHOB|nr:DNA alkylation repair protein [Rubellimicrobium mesophilum]EYD75746.1 DNA alkylation repair enzyme [Rubellimicrobium mesophilum DSM 19309]